MRTLYVGLVVLVCVSQVAFPQAMDGNLVGTVLDPSGAPIQGAEVQLENTATGVKPPLVKTNDQGEYRFNNLLPGAYKLTATKDGFSRVTLQGIQIQLNKT